MPVTLGCDPSMRLLYRIGAEDAHVIAALESRRIGYGALAHAAPHLADRFVFVLFHPVNQVR